MSGDYDEYFFQIYVGNEKSGEEDAVQLRNGAPAMILHFRNKVFDEIFNVNKESPPKFRRNDLVVYPPGTEPPFEGKSASDPKSVIQRDFEKKDIDGQTWIVVAPQPEKDKIPLKTSILADGVKEKLSLAVFYVVDSKENPIGTGYFVDPRVAISAAHTFPESVKVGTTITGYFGKPQNGKTCQLVVNFIDRVNDFIIFGLQIGADDAPAYLEPSPVGLEIGDECILAAYQIGIHEELPELGKEPSVGVFQGAVVKAHARHFVYSAASFAGDSGGSIILRGGQAAGMHIMTVNQAKELREHKKLEEKTATSADIVQHVHSVEHSVASLIESLNSGSLAISVSSIMAAYQSDQDSKRKAK